MVFIMTQYVNITLPEPTYRRLKRWAELRQKNVDELIADILRDALQQDEEPTIPLSEPDTRLLREKAAFNHLFPQLKAKYPDQYVAIHDGELVDHDENYDALFERVDDRFPDSFVWLAQVEDSPMGTVAFRSPRFVEDAT